jgi:hypothetical protein
LHAKRDISGESALAANQNIGLNPDLEDGDNNNLSVLLAAN